MTRRIWTLAAAMTLTGGLAAAQDAAFIQIEAQPSLARAEDRVRDYASYLSNVNGFALGRGWYGIALGPYAPGEAAEVLRQLRANGQVPRDSYVEEPERYRQRFYPVGAGAVVPNDFAGNASQGQGQGQSEGQGQSQDRNDTAQDDTGAAETRTATETPQEARRSERRLTRAERERLQVALKWAGFYDGPIDAAFGRGTRGSMADWQRANSHEATGVLTTRQRAELLEQYNAVLDGLGLERVADDRAGIAMRMPMEVVAYEDASSPFVRYGPTGDLPARVLLISERGDRDTLWGLYEIMQTLEIVPPGGERSRQRDRFVLTGADDEIVSHTEARLQDGVIKGFTLIWPAGDEDRRTRLLSEMQASFERLPGTVLDASTAAAEEQSVDLVAGLEIRQPLRTASGFFVDGTGAVVTALDAVAGCGRITLDDAHEARVVARDAELGAAVLRPVSDLAPREVASFRTDPPRLQSEVAVSGYSFGGVLPAPTLTYGRLEDVRGLSGEESLKRLALAAEPGDVGGPVLDEGGAVLGMLLPRDSSGRQLPDSVSFAAKAEALQAFVVEAGLTVDRTSGAAAMDPEDLSRVAGGMTVLVNCWE